MADIQHSTLHSNKSNLHRSYADITDFTRDSNFSASVTNVDNALKDLASKVAAIPAGGGGGGAAARGIATQSFGTMTGQSSQLTVYTITIPVSSTVQEAMMQIKFWGTSVGFVHIFKGLSYAISEGHHYNTGFTEVHATNKGYGSTATSPEYLAEAHMSGYYYAVLDAYFNGSSIVVKVTNVDSYDISNVDVSVDYITK